MISRSVFTGFVVLLIFNTFGQVSFKLAALCAAPAAVTFEWIERLAACPWTYCAVGGYLGAFVCWMTILKEAAIGPAFAAAHLQVVTVLIASVLFLGETLSLIQVIGSACIVGGVIALATGPRQGSHGVT
jgi:drug/metabolite transporter (DMT)-like permease